MVEKGRFIMKRLGVLLLVVIFIMATVVPAVAGGPEFDEGDFDVNFFLAGCPSSTEPPWDFEIWANVKSSWKQAALGVLLRLMMLVFWLFPQRTSKGRC